MRTFVVLALVATAVSGSHLLNELKDRVISPEAEKLTGQALVDYINSHQQLYKAKLNTRFAGIPEHRKMEIIGGVRSSLDEMSAQLDKEGRVEHSSLAVDIPESFDSREAWPSCDSIGLIRDQSTCGSCWAFGAAEIISDRICIATNGAQKVNISADDIMSCCGLRCGSGCNGGYPIEAMKWWVSTGVVSGSNYQEHAGCLPYPFPPCEHHNDNTNYAPCAADDAPTPKCTKTCQSGYPVPYAQDKHFGKSSYGLANKVADIQKEIMTNGPVEASFNVFEDFEHYTGGVYIHTSGKYLGGHAVKIIGWGVDAGTPYWLVANSWNNDWGENGFFRIIRGVNECQFEAGIVAGLPKV